MSDIRALRLAIKEKLDHRRRLITENSRLRRERDAAHEVMKSAACNFALEECADRIVMDILTKAMEASQTIAEQTIDSGNYVVGIDVPSLHIRHHVSRMDMRLFDGNAPFDRPIRQIRVPLK